MADFECYIQVFHKDTLIPGQTECDSEDLAMARRPGKEHVPTHSVCMPSPASNISGNQQISARSILSCYSIVKRRDSPGSLAVSVLDGQGE